MRTPYVVLAACSALLLACGGGSAAGGSTATYATGGTVCVAGPDGIPLIENVGRLTAVRTPDADFDALIAEAEAGWEARGTLEGTEAAIDAWERAILAPTPEDADRSAILAGVFTDLAKAYYWLAHAHVRYEGDEARMLALYETGVACGGNAIALGNEGWNRAMLYETPIPDAVDVLGVDDVPAVYWYATNLGRWGLLRGIATVLSRVNDIYALMSTVESLDDGYFYNATNRYFGVYYTKLPFGNPDVDQAERRLQACIQAHPEYLETRVLYAYDWGIVTQDRATAEQQLQLVIDADLDAAPELRPENENAQRRARQLLDELDEIFR